MAVTLNDVARACGMDTSTVSRALRGDARVKAATQELIRNKADELGYVPNLAARTLAAGKTGTVWFAVPHLGNPLERVPAEAASRFLHEAGYDLMVAIHHNDPDVFARMLNRLRQGGADGAVIIPGTLEPEPYLPLVDNGFPLVFLDRHPEELPVPIVTTDNRGAAAELVRQCADWGAQSCISLFGDHNAVERYRRDGALGELGERQIPVLLPQDGLISADTAERLPERIAIVGTQQGTVQRFWAENSGVLRGKTMVFGVFDGWSGEPHPAERAFTCLQDFTSMARLAVDRILGMIRDGKQSKVDLVTVPVEKLVTVTRTY